MRSKRCVGVVFVSLMIDFKYISYLLVCQKSGEIHPGPEHQRSKSVDQPDEEDDPDSGVPERALRAVEVSQRNRRRMSIPVFVEMNIFLKQFVHSG